MLMIAQIKSKLDIICGGGSKKLRDLLNDGSELRELLSPAAAKRIISSIKLDERNLAAHSDLDDTCLLHDALRLERAGVQPPWDTAQFANLERTRVRTILVLMGKAQSTIHLQRIQFEPSFSIKPEPQLQVHSRHHDLL